MIQSTQAKNSKINYANIEAKNQKEVTSNNTQEWNLFKEQTSEPIISLK